jgi:succinyl-diaminopimelate desuccinylase
VTDLLARAASLVGISSESYQEEDLANLVEAIVAAQPHLTVTRIGDNVIARTELGRPTRVLVAGHLDTVSSAAGLGRIEGDALYGRGAADMKGTLAVMLTLAQDLVEPRHDLTWVFYAREEVARADSGLREIQVEDASLLEADVAILGEPTAGAVEAGCQGTLRMRLVLEGASAHVARPWMGLNAVRRLEPVLGAINKITVRQVEIDGVVYTEQFEPVGIEGGTGGNVIPDEAAITVNYRFAPDRSAAEAEAWVRSQLEPLLERAGDRLDVKDLAGGALPALTHPVLAELVEGSGRPVAAKVGWTDVATFAELGVPAANFGAGDPQVAHHADEHVSLGELEHVNDVLRSLLS